MRFRFAAPAAAFLLVGASLVAQQPVAVEGPR